MKSSGQATGEAKSGFVSPLIKTLLILSGGVALYLVASQMRQLFRERRLGEESLSWPQTEGEVIRSEYQYGRRSYCARISYRYEVKGTSYVSDQITVASD